MTFPFDKKDYDKDNVKKLKKKQLKKLSAQQKEKNGEIVNMSEKNDVKKEI